MFRVPFTTGKKLFIGSNVDCLIMVPHNIDKEKLKQYLNKLIVISMFEFKGADKENMEMNFLKVKYMIEAEISEITIMNIFDWAFKDKFPYLRKISQRRIGVLHGYTRKEKVKKQHPVFKNQENNPAFKYHLSDSDISRYIITGGSLKYKVSVPQNINNYSVLFQDETVPMLFNGSNIPSVIILNVHIDDSLLNNINRYMRMLSASTPNESQKEYITKNFMILKMNLESQTNVNEVESFLKESFKSMYPYIRSLDGKYKRQRPPNSNPENDTSYVIKRRDIVRRLENTQPLNEPSSSQTSHLYSSQSDEHVYESDTQKYTGVYLEPNVSQVHDGQEFSLYNTNQFFDFSDFLDESAPIVSTSETTPSTPPTKPPQKSFMLETP